MIGGGINDMVNYKRVMGSTTRSPPPPTCSNRLRGFRLYTKRLSINRLRVRFMKWLRTMNRFKKCYERAVRSIRKGLTSYRKSNALMRSCHASELILRGGERKSSSECRLKSLARTNSFYTEAIADCLEFIKRNSLDHHPDDDDDDGDGDGDGSPISIAATPLIR